MRELPAVEFDERGLQAALELARQTAGLASPNPAVGCVLARAGSILGQGAHRYDGRDHAEIVALAAAAAAGHDARGATAYVTLEPCSHRGRTGPCADALLAAGIARCVVATIDPNPSVRGKGVAWLRAGGVQVDVADPASPVALAARRLNDAFAFAVQFGRPFVTLKAALSVDGKLAPRPGIRTPAQPFWLTGPTARADVQTLRHEADALITGVGTVLADDPSLTDRTGLPRRRPLLRVVLDSAFRTPPGAALVRSAADDLLIVGSSAPQHPQGNATQNPNRESRKQALRDAGAEVHELPSSASADTGATVDLGLLLHELHQRGLRGVLLEAGSRVNGSFLQQELVDKAVLYYAETELGEAALPFATGFGSPYTLQAGLTCVERSTFPHGSGEDVRFSGYLHDPWTNFD